MLSLKIVTIVFCAHFFVTHSAPIITSGDIDELFEIAWEFHNKLNPRQEEINSDVFEFRLSVSKAIKNTSKDSLLEVEENAKKILEMEKPVMEAVDTLKLGDCASNLKTLLTGITDFTGFQSSNCIKQYDAELNKEIQWAQQLIADYDGVFTNFQQLVVQAFIGRNEFIEQEQIIEKIGKEYEKSLDAWQSIRLETENFVKTLNDNIEIVTFELKLCMLEIQDATSAAYEFVTSGVQTCVDFENSSDLVKFTYEPLKLEDILPKRDFDYFYKAKQK